MDGFGRAIGDAISGAFSGVVAAIGGALAGAFDSLAGLPGGWLWLVGAVALVVIAWRVVR